MTFAISLSRGCDNASEMSTCGGEIRTRAAVLDEDEGWLNGGKERWEVLVDERCVQ